MGVDPFAGKASISLVICASCWQCQQILLAMEPSYIWNVKRAGFPTRSVVGMQGVAPCPAAIAHCCDAGFLVKPQSDLMIKAGSNPGLAYTKITIHITRVAPVVKHIPLVSP